MLALRVLLSVCLSLEWVVKPGWWLHSLSGHATWVVRPSSIPEPTLLHEAFEFVVATKAITSKSVECVDSFSYSTPLSPSPPHHTRSRPCVEQLISCHNRVCLWATTHESRCLPAWLPAFYKYTHCFCQHCKVASREGGIMCRFTSDFRQFKWIYEWKWKLKL